MSMQALTRIVRSAAISRNPTACFLRPLIAPAACPKLYPFVRCFATGKIKKLPAAKANPPSVTAQLVKKLNEEIVYEEENYESPPSVEDGPPKGWSAVEMGDLIGDDEGFVVVERNYKNEKICVLTSTQVLDDDMVDEEEEEDDEGVAQPQLDEDEDDEDLVSGTMLIAISKKSQSQPLFIECSMDRYGCQISRLHIGAGLSGLNDEMRGPSGILYHAYMAYRQEDGGEAPEVTGEGSEMTSSPYFDTLDEGLQEKWEAFIEERGVNEELVTYLFDMLEDKEQGHYVRFLATAKDWLSDAPAAPAEIPS